MAEQLSKDVVDCRSAGASELWRVIWAKPLYANTKVSIADNWVEAIRPVIEPDGWRWLGTDDCRVTKKGPGRARQDFEYGGPSSASLRQTSIAPHRIFSIQGAANALRSVSDQKAPLAPLSDVSVAEAADVLIANFGFGWGPVTCLHLLTDLGLAVKPDLHLIRTANFLGLTSLAGATGASAFQLLALVERVEQLLQELTGGSVTPAERRRVDKVMMEISVEKLLD